GAGWGPSMKNDDPGPAARGGHIASADAPLDGLHAASTVCHPFNRRSSMRFRAVLLGGVTAGILLAGAVGAVADDFLWIAPDSQNWEALEYWAVDGIAAVRLPEIGDLVQVSGGGTADLYGEHSADTLDLGGGTVWVNSGAVLNLEALNIS